ncbi:MULTISPECIES: type I-E CRISPR-associated protein Cse2/CasB [Kitasatospora]|uniref:type I-E CRISPR-associated protein Cse2/CasB n=1 Tax=Kitasatospora TaxID=2063 RepID=UPI000CC78760|nr:type I-E CRISPR-associated protein Cse2/CasB [Kitasatospora sp. GP30]MDH6139870.1 CRISPR type I-E-associated protein CasB/Cse2 [Kitasatospora sp. GP30]
MTSTSTNPSSSTHHPPAPRRPEDRFVDDILDLCEGTRARADLRSGLGRPLERCGRMDRYLARRLSTAMSPEAVRARYVLAALIAARPRSAREAKTTAPSGTVLMLDWPARRARANLGASLAKAVNDGVVKPGSVEDDLLAMAYISLDGVYQRLPGLTERLQTKDIAIDWAVLLRDLTFWASDRDAVVTSWQTAYYQACSRTEPAESQPVKRQPADFVDRVIDLCAGSTAARSDLETGLGLPVERCHRMHRHLIPLLPERLHPDDRRAHYATAALIASRPPAARRPTAAEEATAPAHRRRLDLGACLAHAVRDGVFKPESAERDLHLLSRQNLPALHERLPALARRLQGKRIRVDWDRLLDDLAWWSRDYEQIAARWMDSYFLIRSRDERKNAQ